MSIALKTIEQAANQHVQALIQQLLNKGFAVIMLRCPAAPNLPINPTISTNGL